MEFEFDPDKSDANREKHGIDFVEAQALWDLPSLDQPSLFGRERRFLRTAFCEGRHWTMVYTLRASRIRLISVRRARKNEVADYERSISEGSGTDLEP